MTTVAEKSWFGESRVLFGGGKGVGFTAIFTGRNEVVAKVIFLHLFVILFTGGVSSRENPPAGRTPPPGLDTPQTRPLWDQTPQEQTPPWDQTPPRADTPPPEADCSIRSTSGRYASYWNAFLLSIEWNSIRQGIPVQEIVAKSLPGALFVCLKLQFVQLFPVRSLFNLQEK